MRELFRMDLKDYDINLKRFRRPSVRGIIIKDDMVKEIAKDYFNHYKNNLIYDRKKLYDSLDKDYKSLNAEEKELLDLLQSSIKKKS